jgi:hypothetical protein
MKIDLATIFKELGLPAGLLLLFTAILGLMGISLDAILTIVEGLVGTFVLIALLINILKWAGVVNDGTAGKWSAAANLVVIVIVTVIYKFYPTFDFAGVDIQIGAFANAAMIIFAYIIQIVGTKSAHLAMTRGLRLPVFSNTLSKA